MHKCDQNTARVNREQCAVRFTTSCLHGVSLLPWPESCAQLAPSASVAPTHLSPVTLLLQILICQNLRNNLQHPNEYIRGVTLRFLCRIREEEILEPLVPSILANLDHR